MYKYNRIVRQVVFALGFILTISFCFAQTTVNNWGEVNTRKQDLPCNAHRMPDGTVILTAIQFDSYYAQRSLLLVSMDENGHPNFTSNIAFADTGIVSTAGVFKQANGGYLVYATFTVDSPYVYAKKFGYLLLDDSLRLRELHLVDIGLKPDTYIETANMKYDNHHHEYYGLQMTSNYTQPEVERYANLLIIDSLLHIQVSFPDSHAYYRHDTTSFYQDIFNGDVQRLNDSLYSLVYSNYYVLGSTMRTYNRNLNKSFEEQGVVQLDSLPYLHWVYFIHPNITNRKWTDTTLILAGVVDQLIWPDNAEDTLLDIDNRNGQSVMVEVNPYSYIAYKYHLFESWKFEDSSCSKNYYHSGITQNMDFMYPSHLYYISFCGYFRITQDLGPSTMKVIALNENFKTKWTVIMNDPYDDPYETPYSILATSDSGCLVFTRKAIRFYNEPLLGRTNFPEYDIRVYKINTKGEITSVQTIKGNDVYKVSVFPNPAKHVITFHNLPLAIGYSVKIWDVTGKSYSDITLNSDATINIDFLKPGLYVYQIQSTTGEKAFKGKFVVE
jgi:hypothetical protein